MKLCRISVPEIAQTISFTALAVSFTHVFHQVVCIHCTGWMLSDRILNGGTKTLMHRQPSTK